VRTDHAGESTRILLMCLDLALQSEVSIPRDWAALVRRACRHSRRWDLRPDDFDRIRHMTVEELALAVLAERRQREAVNP
jgi:hypothetical protein